jgi:hypothetical protein
MSERQRPTFSTIEKGTVVPSFYVQKELPLLPNPILVPEEFVRPFSVAFVEIMREPTQQIIRALRATTSLPKTSEEQASLQRIHQGLDMISTLLNNLITQDIVTVVPLSGGWEFKFKKSQKAEHASKKQLDTPVSLDPDAVYPFASALNHHINNALSTPMGYAELLTLSNNNQIRKQATHMLEASQSLEPKLKDLFKAGELTVAKDENGQPMILVQNIMEFNGVKQRGYY